MDKNTIIGFVLIAAVLIGFMYFNKSEEPKPTQTNQQTQAPIQADSNSAAVANDSLHKPDNFFVAQKVDAGSNTSGVDSLQNRQELKDEQLVSLENDKIKIEFSTKGGRMVSAQLKGYKRYTGDSLYLFQNNDAEFNLLLTNVNRKTMKTSELHFTPILVGDSLTMRYAYAENQHIDFIYKLFKDDYMLKFDVNLVGMQAYLDREKANILELQWFQKIRRQEKNAKTEGTHTHVNYKYVGHDVEELEADNNQILEVKEPVKWIAFKDQFFASIFLADNRIETTLLESKVLNSDEYIKSCTATIYASAEQDINANTIKGGFSYYLGPLSYTHLKEYDDNVSEVNKMLELDKLVPLGWSLFRLVNQYFVIPLFNVLKSTGMSMGLVILLLTIIVKLIISPLTFKSFMSSAKMRVLKPQIDVLSEKFPKQEQAMEKQQATMALYRKAGVNPMGGCIPMLLQMPVIIALFQFFPNAIDLRQQNFLWADDLSTYDAVISWSTSFPLIGNHLSLFCILMTVTNIVYTKFNMDMTNTGQQQMPGMKWMMYLMPLVFFFMLNDFPAGLTYYYFVSLLITIILTLIFRFSINEEKVLAKLEANKAKPKKKSGFMARLEEAQRLQQQRAREESKKGKKK